VLKVGRSAAGQRAAISHTAHLAGSDTAYDATFRRHGVIRVEDQEALLAILPALARLPRPGSRRVAIVTTSGGAGTWAADHCEAYGIAVPELSAALQRDILAMLPHFAAAGNPVDVTGQAVEDGGATLVRVVARLIESHEIDGVLINMGLATGGRIAALQPALRPLLEGATKPVIFHSHIFPSEENLAAIAEIGGVGVRSLRAAAAAFDALARLGEFQLVRPKAPAIGSLLADAGVEGVPDDALCRSLLDHYGIATPPAVLAATRDEAERAAQKMGFPVVLKIQSPDVQHKTEAGGVALNVGAADVAQSYDAILASVKRHAPDARIEGIMVQTMMPPGQEMIVGILDDVDFGPLVMLGAGGIYAEVLRDTVFSPAPIDQAEALRMIDQLQCAAILKGTRGRPPADIGALAELLVRVGDLAVAEAQRLRQFDLNPVIVYPAGEGVFAVDALIVAGPAAIGGHAPLCEPA
jgi:acetyltransferase